MSRKKRTKKNVAQKTHKTLNEGVLRLGYEGAERTPTRGALFVSTLSEDRELPPWKRQILISEARNQIRNFSLGGFALRKHLQYVASYRFRAGTPNEDFNRRLERRVERWKSRKNCDAAGRRTFDELMVVVESLRAVDGDVGIIRRIDGRLQIIESDRIRQPIGDALQPDWVQGVKVSTLGRPLRFAISKRLPCGGFEPEKEVDARWFDLLGYFTRNDQIRGVSLFAPAVKQIANLYKGLDYALAKLKLEQLFGLKTKFDDGGSLLAATTEATTDSASEIAKRATEYFGADIMHVALKTDENVEFFESNNPSQNFQAFCESVIRMVFAALDVPYSFYDGSKTNFYGSEGEFEQYADAVLKKQRPTISLLNEWTFDWLLPLWRLDEDDPLELPNGWTFSDVARDCGWSGAGLPYWRMFRNIKEIQTAISAGLVSPYLTADGYGEDMRRNVREIADLRRYASENGVALPYGERTNVNVGL